MIPWIEVQRVTSETNGLSSTTNKQRTEDTEKVLTLKKTGL